MRRAGAQDKVEPRGTDEELLRSFLDGDENAFEVLVGRYEAPLRRLAYAFVRDRGMAEDIAQESFLRAYRKASSFRFGREGGFKSWLYRIAVNRAQDELRRRRRKPEHELREAETSGSGDAVEQHAVRREMEGRLREALAELRTEYREAIVLKDVEGMTYAEIANVLGWPLGTVQVRVHRARVELRERLRGIYRKTGPGSPYAE